MRVKIVIASAIIVVLAVTVAAINVVYSNKIENNAVPIEEIPAISESLADDSMVDISTNEKMKTLSDEDENYIVRDNDYEERRAGNTKTANSSDSGSLASAHSEIGSEYNTSQNVELSMPEEQTSVDVDSNPEGENASSDETMFSGKTDGYRQMSSAMNVNGSEENSSNNSETHIESNQSRDTENESDTKVVDFEAKYVTPIIRVN